MATHPHQDFYHEIDKARHRPGCFIVLIVVIVLLAIVAGAYYVSQTRGWL